MSSCRSACSRRRRRIVLALGLAEHLCGQLAEAVEIEAVGLARVARSRQRGGRGS